MCVCVCAGQPDLCGGEDRGAADGEWAETQRRRPGGHRPGCGAGQDCVQRAVRFSLYSFSLMMRMRMLSFSFYLNLHLSPLTSGGAKREQQAQVVNF